MTNTHTNEQSGSAEQVVIAADSRPTKPRRKRRMARQESPEPSKALLPAAEQPEPAAPTVARATSKIAQVIALLERDGGATLGELVEATGWQPHTTRAALTGLRKKGHAIARDKRDDVTCYRITSAA